MTLKELLWTGYERLLDTLGVAWIIVVDTAFVIGWVYADSFADIFFKAHEPHGLHEYVTGLFRAITSIGIFLIAASHIAKDVAKAFIGLVREISARWKAGIHRGNGETER